MAGQYYFKLHTVTTVLDHVIPMFYLMMSQRHSLSFQATVGTSEDGVMTSGLLERLFSGKTGEDGESKVSLPV